MIARVVFWLLVGLVALAPLPFGSNRPWAWSLLAAGSGLLLATWAGAAIVNPALHALAWPRYRLLAVVFAPALGWLAFQASGWSPAAWHHPLWRAAEAALAEPVGGAISLSPEDSWHGVMRWLGYGAIFYLALQLCRRSRRARAALWAICLAACGYAIYGMAAQLGDAPTVLGFPKTSYHGSLTGTFINRNHFAIHVGLGLVVTLSLIVEQVQAAATEGLSTRAGIIRFLDNIRLPLYLLMIAFVVLATALLLAHSRAGLFSAGLAIMALLGAFALSQPLRSRALLAFGGIIAAVAIAIVAVSGEAILNRMGDLGADAGERGMVYGLALGAIAERPALGTGLGTFGAVFRLQRDERFGPTATTYDVAHNSYLELAVEAGLPAAALILAGFVVMALVFLRGARSRRHNVVYPCAGLAALVLVASHALVDFSLQIPAIAATFAFVAGIAYAQSWHSDE